MINLNILKMASDTKYYGLKNIYTHQAKIKNRVCGDIIEIEVKIKKDKINLMRYQTEACIFCQASASILANQIKKFSIKSLKQDINFFSKLIQNKEDQLPAKFKSLKITFKLTYQPSMTPKYTKKSINFLLCKDFEIQDFQHERESQKQLVLPHNQ